MPGKRAQHDEPGKGRDYSGSGGVREGGLVSYLDADAKSLQECVESVTLAGDAVLFARTSDGGALSVRILSGGRTFAHYPASAAELSALLSELIELSKA